MCYPNVSKYSFVYLVIVSTSLANVSNICQRQSSNVTLDDLKVLEGNLSTPGLYILPLHEQPVPWVYFRLCRYYTLDQLDRKNTSMTNSKDYVRDCYTACEGRNFSLHNSTCFCNLLEKSDNSGCLANKCGDNRSVCGTSVSFGAQCFCYYEPYTSKTVSLIGSKNIGECAYYHNNTKGTQTLSADLCEHSHKFTCIDGGFKQEHVQNNSNKWLDAILHCSKINKQMKGLNVSVDHWSTLIRRPRYAWGLWSGHKCVLANVTLFEVVWFSRSCDGLKNATKLCTQNSSQTQKEDKTFSLTTSISMTTDFTEKHKDKSAIYIGVGITFAILCVLLILTLVCCRQIVFNRFQSNIVETEKGIQIHEISDKTNNYEDTCASISQHQANLSNTIIHTDIHQKNNRVYDDFHPKCEGVGSSHYNTMATECSYSISKYKKSHDNIYNTFADEEETINISADYDTVQKISDHSDYDVTCHYDEDSNYPNFSIYHGWSPDSFEN